MWQRLRSVLLLMIYKKLIDYRGSDCSMTCKIEEKRVDNKKATVYIEGSVELIRSNHISVHIQSGLHKLSKIYSVQNHN